MHFGFSGSFFQDDKRILRGNTHTKQQFGGSWWGILFSCLHSVLDNIIRRGFVWPNRFNFYLPIEAVQNLRDQTFAMPSPQGVLQILVSEARHLMKKDHSLAGGKSDPYITISIGEKRISFVDRVGIAET